MGTGYISTKTRMVVKALERMLLCFLGVGMHVQ